MAISRLTPTSVSTEPIATIKITGSSSITTLATPLTAGTYKISSGYSAGSIAVTFYDSSDNPLTYIVFATSGMFTLQSTASKIGIVAPNAAINGIVDFNLLTRGVNSSAVGLTTWNTKALAEVGCTYNQSMQIVNGYLYVIGGTNASGWDQTGGTAVIQRWDMNPSNSFSVVYNPGNTSINGGNASCVIGNYIYFNRGAAGAGTALLRFDTTNNTLTTLASRPSTYSINCLIPNSAGTKIYTFGGYSSGAGSYVYDVASNTWSSIASLPFSTDGWGSNLHRDTSNSDRINIHGQSGSGSRYRYNITANTYTNVGGTSISFYTNHGGYTPNNNYFLMLRSISGSPQSQFSVIKTDNTEDAQYVYTPTASALFRDNIIPNSADTNGGNDVKCTSTYIFAHTNGQTVVYYTPTSAFIGALN